MKVFYKYFAFPLITAVIASCLYLADCIFAGLFVEGASFLWVAFINWTVFYGATISERIRGLIGLVIGFGVAIIMMLITGSFTLNIWTISISCMLGIFVMNFFVMQLDHTKKIWTNSITGVFTAISLVFSGYGIGLSPLASVSEAFLMLGILVVYAILGMICGFCSITFSAKVKKKLEKLEGKTEETPKENETKEEAVEEKEKKTTKKVAK